MINLINPFPYYLSLGTEEPSGGEFFCTRPDWPWGPPSLLYNVYQAFPWGKAAGAWR